MSSSYFTPHQRATVAAAMARVIPTDHEPGAREADTIEFLDRYLSGIAHIYALPDGSGFEVLEGRRAAAWTRRVELLRQTYAAGISDLDRRSHQQHDAAFVDLSEEQQDGLLVQMEQDSAGAGEPLRPDLSYGGPSEPALQQTDAEVDLAFFPLLVTHTRQGFYADPVYGGNRDHIGWQVIGFPGPRHLAEVHDGSYSTLPWFADERQHPTNETIQEV